MAAAAAVAEGGDGEPHELTAEDVVEICDVARAEDVRVVRLTFQRVPGLALVAPFRGLTVLQLPNCGIESLAGLSPPPPQLRFLDLSFNAITRLPAEAGEGGEDEDEPVWPGTPQLQVLLLHANEVADWRGFLGLRALPRLVYVTAFGNPVSTQPLYRHLVANLLPQLEALDHHLVTAEERIQGADWSGTRFASLTPHMRLQLPAAAPPTAAAAEVLATHDATVAYLRRAHRAADPVVSIQRVFRGWRGRSESRRRWMRLYYAAVRIQAIARGVRQRARVQRELEALMQQLVADNVILSEERVEFDRAARRIQVAWCAHDNRKYMNTALRERVRVFARHWRRFAATRRRLAAEGGQGVLLLQPSKAAEAIIQRAVRIASWPAPVSAERMQAAVDAMVMPSGFRLVRPGVLRTSRRGGRPRRRARIMLDALQPAARALPRVRRRVTGVAGLPPVPVAREAAEADAVPMFRPRSSWILTVFQLLREEWPYPRHLDASVLVSEGEAARLAAAANAQAAWRARAARAALQPPLAERMLVRRAATAVQRAWRSRRCRQRLRQLRTLQQLAGSLTSRTVFVEMSVFRSLAEVPPVDEPEVLEERRRHGVPSHALRFGYSEEHDEVFQIADVRPDGALRTHVPAWMHWAPPRVGTDESPMLGAVNSVLVKATNVWRASAHVREDVLEEEPSTATALDAPVRLQLLRQADLEAAAVSGEGTALFHKARALALLTTMPEEMDWDSAGQWLLAVRFRTVDEARRRAAILTLRTWDQRRRAGVQVLSAAHLSALWLHRQGSVAHRRPAPWAALQLELPSGWSAAGVLGGSRGGSGSGSASGSVSAAASVAASVAGDDVEEEPEVEAAEEEPEDPAEEPEDDEEDARDEALLEARRAELLAQPTVGRRSSVVAQQAEPHDDDDDRRFSTGTKPAEVAVTFELERPASTTSSSAASGVSSVVGSMTSEEESGAPPPLPSYIVAAAAVPPPDERAPDASLPPPAAVALLTPTPAPPTPTPDDEPKGPGDADPMQVTQHRLTQSPARAAVHRAHVAQMSAVVRADRALLDEQRRELRARVTRELAAATSAVKDGKRALLSSFSLDAAMLRRLLMGPAPRVPHAIVALTRRRAAEAPAAAARTRPKVERTANEMALARVAQTMRLRERGVQQRRKERAAADAAKAQRAEATAAKRVAIQQRKAAEAERRDRKGAHRDFVLSFSLQHALLTRNAASAQVEEARAAEEARVRRAVAARRANRKARGEAVLSALQDQFVQRREQAIAMQLGTRAQLQWREQADGAGRLRVATHRSRARDEATLLRRVRDEARDDIMLSAVAAVAVSSGSGSGSGSVASVPEPPPPSGRNARGRGPLGRRIRGRKFSRGAPPRVRPPLLQDGHTRRPASPEQIRVQNTVLEQLAAEARAEMAAAMRMGLGSPGGSSGSGAGSSSSSSSSAASSGSSTPVQPPPLSPASSLPFAPLESSADSSAAAEKTALDPANPYARTAGQATMEFRGAHTVQTLPMARVEASLSSHGPWQTEEFEEGSPLGMDS